MAVERVSMDGLQQALELAHCHLGIEGGTKLLTARALSGRYRAGSLSPVEVTEACLATAEAHNEQFRAFVSLNPEEALDAARAAEARWRTGRP